MKKRMLGLGLIAMVVIALLGSSRVEEAYAADCGGCDGCTKGCNDQATACVTKCRNENPSPKVFAACTQACPSLAKCLKGCPCTGCP